MKTDYRAVRQNAGTAPVDSRLSSAVAMNKTTHCPFPEHKDDTPSFGPYMRDGLTRWKCLGCGWEGDAIDFVMKFDNVDRIEALRRIEGKVGAGPVLVKPTTEHVFGWDDARLARAVAALPGNKAMHAFLATRGISLATATAMKFGVEGEYLVMPTFDTDGKLCAVKRRHPKPTGDQKKWIKSNRDANVYHLFNRSAVTGLADVYVVESELDAAMLNSFGFEAVSVDSAGHKLQQPDTELLQSVPRVLVGTDADIEGEKCAAALKNAVGAKRCLRVTAIGYKDFGELFADKPKGFADQIRRLVRYMETTRPDFTFDDLLTEEEVINEQGIEIKYAIDKLVPLRRITMLFGAEKSCKSLLAFYYAKCAANGEKVFGQFHTMKIPAIYLDAEDGILGTYIGWMKGVGPQMVRLRTLATGIPALEDPYLLEICRKYQPLLVVDSLHKFMPKGEKTNAWRSNDMEPILQKLRDLCTAGATVVLIHHATKADVEMYRDSNVIGAGVDFLFALVGEEQQGVTKRVRLVGLPSRGAQPPTLNLLAFPNLIEQGCFLLEDKPPMSNLDIVVEWLEKQPQGATLKGDAEHVGILKGVTGMRNEDKCAALKEGIEKGQIKKDSKGVYRVPRVGEPKAVFSMVPQNGNQSGTEEQELPF